MFYSLVLVESVLMEIVYIDRKTNKRAVEKVYGSKALLFLYGDGHWIRRVLCAILSKIPLFSQFYGYLQKLPRSRHKIKPFIKTFGVDASEFASQEFVSFNDFFIRKLKKECRPIVSGSNRLAMPADGRYLVDPKIGQFSIKGQSFDLASFLQDPVLTRRFQNGSMAIVRLCPTDYHRFHFPCDGVPDPARLINGHLYSVSPIALQKRLSILSENKRMITEFETTSFGTILYVEIGATMVGTIQQTFVPNKPVRKGDEKGYFEFGGSCIVMLFEKGQVEFDADLVENSRQGFETLGRFGEGMGTNGSSY